jgi:hypothetical protein
MRFLIRSGLAAQLVDGGGAFFLAVHDAVLYANGLPRAADAVCGSRAGKTPKSTLLHAVAPQTVGDGITCPECDVQKF